MKNLITAIASLILFFIFILQFVSNQIVYTKMVGIESLATKACIQNEDRAEICKKIADAAGCSESEVTFKDLNDGSFNIKVPIKNIIAAGRVLGISDEENFIIYETERVKGENGNEEPDNSLGATDSSDDF